MSLLNKKIAGLLLFVGSTQFVLAAIIAEALDTEYTFLEPMNWLGDGSVAIIFKSSIFLLGLLIVVAAFLIHRPLMQQPFMSKLFWFVLTMTGIGALAMGLFNEASGIVHVIAVRIFWVFAIPAAVLSVRIQKKPFAYISVVWAIVVLVATILFLTAAYLGPPAGPSFFLGIGRGGMQRMIQYPIFLWLMGLGAHLSGSSNETALTNKM
jgi:hypothetical membrane protein